MPKPRKNDLVRCQHFTWRLFRRDGVWYADGRSNERNPGRHSLGTRNRADAEQSLSQLDLTRAIAMGLAKPALLVNEKHVAITLAEGRRLYEEHLGRPRVAGGVRKSTKKRYSTVFDKFIIFANSMGVMNWNDVTKRVLNLYASDLESKEYKSKTLRNELTTLGQAIRWLVQEQHLLGVEPPQLKLTKVESERAYCYERAEVAAMIGHCQKDGDLIWLANVIIGLACTGLRISELSALRWSDLDLDHGMLMLTDESGHGKADDRRQLKTGRSRSLPLHADLLNLLKTMPQHGARVFYGPRGGKLKPDTVRNILIRDVIKPLAKQFPGSTGKKNFAQGRLHSFRHFFASMCANQGTAERIAMEWLGHADSEMVRHYYHLHDAESRQQMAKLNLLGSAGKRSPGQDDGAASIQETSIQNGETIRDSDRD